MNRAMRQGGIYNDGSVWAMQGNSVAQQIHTKLGGGAEMEEKYLDER